MESAMLLLLLVLVCVMTYMLFSPTSIIGPWLDRHCIRGAKWKGDDIEPEYNTGQKIHDAISQEKVPFTPSLDVPFEDPEVPYRPLKKSKKRKTATNRNVGPVNGRKKKRRSRQKK